MSSTTPFFSGGDSGADFLAFLGYRRIPLGFVLSATVVGALAERRWDRSVRSSIGEMFLGEVILYASRSRG
jgi:biotin transporter BioY